MSEIQSTERRLLTSPTYRPPEIDLLDDLKVKGLFLVGLGVTMMLFAGVSVADPFLREGDTAMLGHVLLLMVVPALTCAYVGCTRGTLTIRATKVASLLLIAFSAAACLLVAKGGLPNAFRIAFLCLPTVILLSGVYAAATAGDEQGTGLAEYDDQDAD